MGLYNSSSQLCCLSNEFVQFLVILPVFIKWVYTVSLHTWVFCQMSVYSLSSQYIDKWVNTVSHHTYVVYQVNLYRFHQLARKMLYQTYVEHFGPSHYQTQWKFTFPKETKQPIIFLSGKSFIFNTYLPWCDLLHDKSHRTESRIITIYWHI